MKQNVYSIFDEKGKGFMQPFFLQNNKVAIRTFANLVNSEGHNFNANPEDYTLYLLGEFDVDNGKIESVQREMLGNGVEFVDSELKAKRWEIGELKMEVEALRDLIHQNYLDITKAMRVLEGKKDEE